MGLAESVLSIKKEKIKKAIEDSKTRLSWRQVEAMPSYKALGANELSFFHIYYKRNIIDRSEKFRQLPPERQQQMMGEWQNRTTATTLEEGFRKPVVNVPFMKGMELGGRAVEEVAKFIEPKVPAGRTTAGLLIKDLPRQVTAEYLRFFKPWNIMAAMGVGQVLRKVAPAIGKGIAKITPEKIKEPLKRFLTVGR